MNACLKFMVGNKVQHLSPAHYNMFQSMTVVDIFPLDVAAISGFRVWQQNNHCRAAAVFE